jgi:hypothetical protein
LSPAAVGQILKNLKFPGHVFKSVEKILRGKERFRGFPEFSDKELRRLVIDLGDHLEDLLDVMYAINLEAAYEFAESVDPNYINDIKMRLKELTEGEGEVMLGRIKNPPLNGNDIKELLGLERGGPQIGEAMKIQIEMLLEDPMIPKQELEEQILLELK